MFMKFIRDRGAAVLPTFAIAAIPMIVATGAVVDYSRSFDQQTVVQDALDTAALAAGKKIGVVSDTAVKAEASTFFNINVGNKVEIMPTLVPNITGSTITLTTQLHVPTYFLGMIGISEFVFNLKAETTQAMGTLEVALVLDNSGSMQGSKIATLITAATNLTNTLYGLGATSTKPDPVKVALIPFTGSVNVGPSNRTSGWMDTTGVAPYNGDNFEGSTGTPPVSNNLPAAVNVFSLYDSLNGTANAWKGCVEERKAPYDVQDDAATTATPATMFVPMFAPDEPDEWTCTTSNGCAKTCNSSVNGSACTSSSAGLRFNGAATGNQDHNNYLPDAGAVATCGTTFTVAKGSSALFTANGHGLVAGQQVVFSTTGALYSGLTAGNTYYVISSGLSANQFRVSTSSGGSAVTTSGSQSGTHSFVTNADWTCANGNAGCGTASAGISQQNALLGQNVANKNLCKYGTTTNKVTPVSITVDVNGFGDDYPGGPNLLCTVDPLTPLTTTKATITTKIGNMVADGITNITSGLMWGWRALSPTAPFTEGRPYSTADNQKIIVLMTDGENTYFPNNEFTLSHYSAWGYVWKSHLGTTSTVMSDWEDKEDERLALACGNAKAAGIKIYTVAFQITDAATLGILSACATDTLKAFTASDSTALTNAFTAIGDDISLLRLAK